MACGLAAGKFFLARGQVPGKPCSLVLLSAAAAAPLPLPLLLLRSPLLRRRHSGHSSSGNNQNLFNIIQTTSIPTSAFPQTLDHHYQTLQPPSPSPQPLNHLLKPFLHLKTTKKPYPSQLRHFLKHLIITSSFSFFQSNQELKNSITTFNTTKLGSKPSRTNLYLLTSLITQYNSNQEPPFKSKFFQEPHHLTHQSLAHHNNINYTIKNIFIKYPFLYPKFHKIQRNLTIPSKHQTKSNLPLGDRVANLLLLLSLLLPFLLSLLLFLLSPLLGFTCVRV